MGSCVNLGTAIFLVLITLLLEITNLSIMVALVIAENRYIAKTMYGDEEEEDAPKPNTVIEEPKFLGFNAGSNEKVCLTLGNKCLIDFSVLLLLVYALFS